MTLFEPYNCGNQHNRYSVNSKVKPGTSDCGESKLLTAFGQNKRKKSAGDAADRFWQPN
jgi:hypothetical protein